MHLQKKKFFKKLKDKGKKIEKKFPPPHTQINYKTVPFVYDTSSLLSTIENV